MANCLGVLVGVSDTELEYSEYRSLYKFTY